MSSDTPQPVLTLAEWRTAATKLFGGDAMQWRFVCPSCKHVASVADWRAGGSVLVRGPLARCGRDARLPFKLNPVAVIDPDGRRHEVFAFAEVRRAADGANVEPLLSGTGEYAGVGEYLDEAGGK